MKMFYRNQHIGSFRIFRGRSKAAGEKPRGKLLWVPFSKFKGTPLYFKPFDAAGIPGDPARYLDREITEQLRNSS